MRSIIRMMTVVFFLFTTSILSMQKGFILKAIEKKRNTNPQKTKPPKVKKPFMLVSDNSGSLIETDIDTALPDDKHGNTLLHILAQLGQADSVLSYIKRGVNIDPLNTDNCTPLLLAVINNHFETVEILLNNGADPNKETIAGLNCLDFAKDLESNELLELLKKHGAKESKTPDGECDTIIITPKTLKYIQKLPPAKQSQWLELFKKTEAETDPKKPVFYEFFAFCKKNNIPISEIVH